MEYNKDNLKELLDNYYDERVAYKDAFEFYEKKLYESSSLSKVWKEMLSKAKDKLDELDVDIQFIQEELKSNNI